MDQPFTPMRVQLMGHVNLGTVRARWLGCILELEDGTRHGPGAIFEAKPIRNPPPVVGMEVFVGGTVVPWRTVELVTSAGGVEITGGRRLSPEDWDALPSDRIRTRKPMPEPEVGMRFKPLMSLSERSVISVVAPCIVLSNGTWMERTEWDRMDPNEVLPGGSNYLSDDDIPF